MKRKWSHAVLAATLIGGCVKEQAPLAATSGKLDLVMQAEGDSVDAAQPFFITPAPHGGIYVSTQAITGLVEELDSLGRLRRLIGGKGEGPGEYDLPSLVIGDGARVIVGDNLGKWHTYDSLGKHQSTVTGTMAAGSQGVLLRGDTIVIAQRANEPARFGFPLHLIAPSGETALSFGVDVPSDDPAHRFAFFRALAKDSDSTFWVARVDRYEIELWSTAGKRLKHLTLQREWFPPFDTDPETIDRQRPVGMLLKLRPDAHGHLLVLLRRARADWRPNPSPTRAWMDPSDGMKYIEEIIEIIDPATGTLLDSIVHRGAPILGFLGDMRVFGITSDSTGRQIPMVYRIRH